MKGENQRGVVAISNRNRYVNAAEVKRVFEAAQAIKVPADREIIHVLSKEFAVDEQSGIKDPIGMSGVRLEAEVHIITGSTTSIQNVIKSVNRAGFQCADIIFSPLASAEATLSAGREGPGSGAGRHGRRHEPTSWFLSKAGWRSRRSWAWAAST